MDRKEFLNVKRIVIKLGTNVLRNENGDVALSRIYSYIESIAKLVKSGKEVVLVTSGAVGLGKKKLGLINKNDDEISIVIDNMIVDVSTLVTSSLSDEIIVALLNYVTKDHMQRYIVSTIRLEIVARLATK